MAKKELLFFLIVWQLCSHTALGNEQFEYKKSDLDFAKDLTNKSKQMTLMEMKKKYLELQNMLGNDERQDRTSNKVLGYFDDPNIGTSFRIFVSSSMSRNLLKTYAKTAKQYDAVLVFSGLPEGSWKKLSELVTEISEEDPESIAMQIDDEAFKEFDIKRVPSFVLSKEEDIFAENPKVTFDKITGSIGIRKVLETFASNGQLRELASQKLEQGENKHE